MSDDEADPELLALLRQSPGIEPSDVNAPAETKVLEGAEYIYNNSIDIALDTKGCKAAANTIWALMQEKEYSTKTWSTHELHPKAKDESTVDFIFTMDVLNFCFWSEKGPDERFAVEYTGKRWTGYWSLVATLNRALDEGEFTYSWESELQLRAHESLEIPITSPDFWQDENEYTSEKLRHVFRSATDEEIPLFEEKMACLREAGQVLYKVSNRRKDPEDCANSSQRFDRKFSNCIKEAQGSAAALVNLLVEHFPCFRDEFRFEGKKVRFYKRAQILVADLWACFEGERYGRFEDIDKITMFAGISTHIQISVSLAYQE